MPSNLGELPVRGNDAIEILINDHQIIKTLLNQLTDGHQAGRKETLEQLKAVLTIHNATEENLVYPALNKVAHKRAESEKLYHETGQADTLLFELDTMLKQHEDAEFITNAEKFRDAVLEHIEDEETKAFPHLRDKVEPQQMTMLTQSVRELRQALRFSSGGRAETGEIEAQRSASR